MPDPFLYPTPYSPGQMAFNNNPELSQLITMFGGPLMGAMAGPGNFMPHMMPGQALMDQFAMRNYQNQTRTASFNLAASGAQNDDVATRLLGMRSALTPNAPTDMNREQASQMAQVLNNPMTKTIAGMFMGPENVERMLHGSRGDVQSLGNSVNRIGYFRQGPGGADRMNAESLEDLTTGVFSHLYEPQGDTEKLGQTARAGGVAGDAAKVRLQKAANMEDRRVVDDADVQSRLTNMGGTKVEQLYKKYVQGGTATDTDTQARELTKFDRAIKESRVLGTNEATVGQLETAAFKQPTAEMRGLTAGQAGQLMETLFQRGALPQAIGSMSDKDKVGAIAETKLDDATLDRLAETMARRQLSEKNEVGAGGKRFSDMTSTEQQTEIKNLTDVSGGLRDQIRDTKKAADAAASGDTSKSAEKILQMTGGSALSGNVDASRTSSRLKEYADSVAAVRDIFGDNGNPNAPMPSLLAVLDQLSQGAMGSINPAQMSTTLRQMQSLARETGVGMNQLATMSLQAGALGQRLGVAPSITMQNVATSMGMTRTAMNRGAFDVAPGGATKEQFQNDSITLLQQGDASDNAKAMAAMRRIYESDPKKYKGTELEAAVSAYTDKASGGEYEADERDEFGNKTGRKIKRNVFEQIGRGKFAAAQAIIQESGGNSNQFFSAVYDPRTMHEFGVAGAGYMTQKHEIVQALGEQGTGGMVVNALSDTALGEELGDGDSGLAAARQIELSNTLAGMVVDSSGMKIDQQISFLEKHMPDKIAASFEQQGMTPDQAKDRAQKVVTQMFGDGKGGIDRTRLDELIGNVGQASEHIYGQNTVELYQRYGLGGDVKGMRGMAQEAAHAKATQRLVGLGSESSPMGRMSDYFMDIGKRGEKFDMGNFVKEMAPFVSDQETLQKYAGEMGAGLHTLSAMRDKVQISGEYIDKLAKDGDTDALKKLGGIKDEVVVSEADLKANRDKKLASLDTEEKVAAEYTRLTGNPGAHISIEERRAAIKENEQFAKDADTDYLNQLHAKTGKEHLTVDELKGRAMRAIGTALEGKDERGVTYAGRQEDIEAVQRGVYHGDNEDAQKNARSAVGRLFAGLGGKAGELAADTETLNKLMSADGEKGTQAILDRLGITKEQFEKDKLLDADKKSNEQQMAEVVTAVQRADELQQLDKVTDEKTAQGISQKADKVELSAQNVYINGAKAGGADQAAAAATPQKPGSPMPATKDAIDAEIAAIDKKEGHWLYDKITDADKARREELIKQRDAVAEKEKTAASSAAASPESTAGRTADKPLPETKTADKDPATAETIKQQNADAAAASAGVPIEDDKTAVSDRNDAALQQSATGAEGAAATPPEQKYDIDPRDFTQSVSQKDGSYASISGPFRDRAGKQIDRPTDGEYFDAMHTVDRAKDDAQNRTGRVGQIGDKYYEEYKSGGVTPAWREVSVGENKTEAEKIAQKNDAALQQKAGLEPGEKPVAAAASPKEKAASTPIDRRLISARQAMQKDLMGTLSKNAAENRLVASLVDRDVEAELPASSTLPQAKTSNVQQDAGGGAIGSANIHPAMASPDQAGGAYSGSSAAGDQSDKSITLNGSLRLEGLHEAILDATAQKAVATPGGGVPVVGTGHMGRSGLPSGQRVT